MSTSQSEWFYSEQYRQPCLVIERQELWGKTVCRTWFPSTNTVAQIDAERLVPAADAAPWSHSRLTYVASAARIVDALSQDILLAPIESPVIPLPHQINALSRAVSDGRVRYLLADEVGLGKTIEAGLILRELKLRGLATRVLVVAPKGLTMQWISEMKIHFNETFRLILPDDLNTLSRITPPCASTAGSKGTNESTQVDGNPWRLFPQIVVPLDSVKPVDKRRGWSKTELSEYNRRRFEDLTAAGWDLVIVDEAHRLGGTTDQVARFRLGKGLADAAPYVLLLSATPHQGKTDAFRRLLSLLDEKAFPDEESIRHEVVQPYVIRSSKRQAIDAEGKPLFKPRRTTLLPVAWQDNSPVASAARHRSQHLLYETVSTYVREGYNQAIKEKRNYVGFLMILMQRLVTSSTRAIRVSLEKRLDALEAPEGQMTFFDVMEPDEWSDLDGQAQLDSLIKARFKALDSERDEVKLLLDTARKVEHEGPDAKAERLLETIYKLQQEESDPELKVLIFTEFVPTQEMLTEFFEERGFEVVKINGSMDIDERLRAQRQFAGRARILVSTDAGGEGLNLQFCHVVVNYDLPWNPMRLEQRIGRIDRIGQKQVVRAINLTLENTVEYRVREVLEQKLALILKEFGVDKTGDVLDSAQAGRMFEDLYVETIIDPSAIETKVNRMISQVRDQSATHKDVESLLSQPVALDPSMAKSLMEHPMPHWVEQMVINYIEGHGGKATRKGKAWHLTWPDGTQTGPVVFNARDAEAVPSAEHLTLESSKIRFLTEQFSPFLKDQRVAALNIPDLPGSVSGYWSLWRIEVSADSWHERRIMSLFRQPDGKTLAPTARHIWEQIVAGDYTLLEGNDTRMEDVSFAQLWRVAEEQGKGLYEDIVRDQARRLERERSKGERSFAARRRVIGRIGLPEVQRYRLAELEREERDLTESLERRRSVLPEMVPLVIAFVRGMK